VQLAISEAGQDSFSVGGAGRKATHYVAKFELGGVTGVVAPIVGKQPADLHFWIYPGEAPLFVKSEGPLVEGGPIWRIELAGPTWN
jgi:hypothetical protein